MSRLRIAISAVQVAVTIGSGLVAGFAIKSWYRELRQARLLFEQMEEDHAVLVRNVIKTNNMFANRKPGPGSTHLPVVDLEELAFPTAEERETERIVAAGQEAMQQWQVRKKYGPGAVVSADLVDDSDEDDAADSV